MEGILSWGVWGEAGLSSWRGSGLTGVLDGDTLTGIEPAVHVFVNSLPKTGDST